MNPLIFALLLGASGCSGHAADSVAGNDNNRPASAKLPETPTGEVALTRRVVDRAAIIPAGDEARFTQELANLERDTTDQLVVVTLPTLNGAPIEDVGRRLGNDWSIGRDDVDNGVLLLVAPNERKVRIEVGLGLEGLLTDARAAAIIQQMLPSFRTGRPAAAVALGIEEISSLLKSDLRRPRRLPKRIAA